MSGHTQLDEARRWTKFPATVLFTTCVLWLVTVLPRAASDWDGVVAQPAETVVGAICVFLLLVVVPLASPLAAIGMLFLQRSALYTGAVLPVVPLAAISWFKAERIVRLFREYRASSSISSFGDAVLDAVILGGLWLIVLVHISYVRRALLELHKAEQWQAVPATRAPQRAAAAATAGGEGAVAGAAPTAAGMQDDTCFLLPENAETDDDD
jgi:hypothetical protein